MLKSNRLDRLVVTISMAIGLSWQASAAPPAVNFGLQKAASNAPTELFSSHPVYVKPSEYASSAVAANLNTRGLALGAPSLSLILPTGEEVVLLRSYLEKRGKGDLGWFGQVENNPDSEAVLTLKRGVVAGRIRIGPEVYELTSTTGRWLTVEHLDPLLFPEIGDDTLPVPLADDDTTGQSIPYAAASSSDTVTTIDLLAVYSNDALADTGSVAQMEAKIQAAVDASNATFINSNMSLRYRLVHIAGINYDTTGSTSDDLPLLRDNTQVASLRNEYGADMVSLLVDTPSSCGTGYVQRSPGSGFAAWAFQVTDVDCAVGNLTFAHEHGHNLGMEHNPGNSSAYPSDGSYDWSYAHYIDGSYRTMMSYSNPCSNGCPRAQQISNPNISYEGHLSGIDGERDNARTGELTGPISAAFRDTVVPLDGSIVFAALGDFGDGSSAEAGVAAEVNSWAPEFIITAGDNRYGSLNFDTAVGQFYCSYLADAGSGDHCNGNGSSVNAFFPSPGNHDYDDGGGINEYLNYFTLPGAGVSGSGTSGSERYYDVVKGPVHIFTLDSDQARASSTDMNAQKAWLQAQLAASTTPWQIVIFHHAPYSSANHGSDPAMQWPFAAWGADAVLSAHDHTYERISVDGIPYFVNGLGGRSRYSFGTPIAGSEVRYNDDYGAMRITANNDQVQFEFVNQAGTVIDSHVIQSSGGSGNLIAARITNSNDDVEERASDGGIDMTSSDIELGDDPGFNEDQTVGLRFTNLDIPQGATILSASLEFTVDEVDTGSTNITIRAQAADNAAAFTSSTNNVTSRSLTGATVNWSISAWDSVGAIKQSPDISALIQEVVDRSGWNAGHAIALVISGSGSRTAESYDGNAAAAPLLRIEYGQPLPPSGTINVQVNSANDDVEETLAGGTMYFDSSDLELGNDPGFNGDQTIGLRFQDIQLPQGATIDAAYLEFTVDETSSGATDVEIAAHATDTAAAFSSTAYNLTDRSQTAAYVPWSIPAWSSVGASAQSPDISTVVQEVVDRVGWKPGNSMVFIISGNGERTAEAYDSAPSAAPRLHVEYSSGATTNTPPVANFSSVCIGLNCSFSDSSSDSDGNISAWSWDFGDGNSSSARNPSHNYAAGGTYTVKLTVTDDDGATGSDNQSVTVIDPNAGNLALGRPAALSSTHSNELTADKAVDGISTGLFNPDRDLAHSASIGPGEWWQVDLEAVYQLSSSHWFNRVDCCAHRMSDYSIQVSLDGVSWTEVSHQTTQMGRPTVIEMDVAARYVRLHQNMAEMINFSEARIFGTPVVNQPPSANFSFTTTDLATNFTDSSTDNDGNIASWSWDFGDGNTSTAQSPSHNYSAAGTYTVNLTVTDNDGATNSTSKDVTVTAANVPPSANFSFTTDDLTAAFTDTSSDSDGTLTGWSWDFGDGNASTAQSPSHTYGAAGTYTVNLTVTDSDGATNSTSKDVTVTAPAPQPPVAPSNLSASLLTTGKGKNQQVLGVELSWTDNSDDEDTFVIERCLETGKGKNKSCSYSGEISTVGADTTGYLDSTGGSGFKYRVKARNAQGDSAYSNEAAP